MPRQESSGFENISKRREERKISSPFVYGRIIGQRLQR
jgi:hypothetical protein